MKKTLFRWLFMLMCICATSLTLFSCSKDDGKEKEVINDFPANTRWTYTDRYTENGIETTVSGLISFRTSTATIVITTKLESSSEKYERTDYDGSYRYTYNDNMVIFEPEKSNVALLEGTITSGIKMSLVNHSTGKKIGDFYLEK